MVPVKNDKNTPVQILSADGSFAPSPNAEPYLPLLDRLTDDDHKRFYRDMVVTRAFDAESANLQRQGQLALWVPSHGQEAAQVGSAHASRPQDTIFPSYREHAVGMIRGIDLLGILALLRGVTHGGWDPTDPKNGNFRLYTLVLATQTLHATGYAMGIGFKGESGTGDPEKDKAVVVYFGDGSTSEGDANEAMIFAASYQTPEVFFLQNNGWAISVPVERQSRTPLYERAAGFGLEAVRIDGNDVLASYAVSAQHLDNARSGKGPQFIEAMTYRVGAHTTSDDPTKYRTQDELESWIARDPITRFESWLRGQGASQSFFDEIDAEAKDFAADIRRRCLALPNPDPELMFDFVYSEDHPLTDQQAEWFEAYEASLEGGER
ncbi:pyruvate dehydrogenase E1 component alpha subunit [Paramicrobacterium humi]|uniref:2-oxoisovalerate dehydrogenase subunit alpha n=1 Tax=Paramicrobacterium humi TaxID=640635 RepID=A0A1H4LNC0_9MICO|nr:thiamine pyrophosphate-dependent dehydrogenase E1 component subunit alpha [Microbacterium humi]SEB72144.1 pyruvate dehydrogenase E1 component alpha subunit [Microbacterium humi]